MRIRGLVIAECKTSNSNYQLLIISHDLKVLLRSHPSIPNMIFHVYICLKSAYSSSPPPLLPGANSTAEIIYVHVHIWTTHWHMHILQSTIHLSKQKAVWQYQLTVSPNVPQSSPRRKYQHALGAHASGVSSTSSRKNQNYASPLVKQTRIANSPNIRYNINSRSQGKQSPFSHTVVTGKYKEASE